MSETGKDRSTRALPSTEPSRWKKPTPLEYSTTWPIGRLADFASFSSLAAAGRAPVWAANHSRPAPTTAHTLAISALFLIAVSCSWVSYGRSILTPSPPALIALSPFRPGGPGGQRDVR